MIKDISSSRSNPLKKEFMSRAKNFNIFSGKNNVIITLITRLRDTQEVELEVLHQANFLDFYEFA